MYRISSRYYDEVWDFETYDEAKKEVETFVNLDLLEFGEDTTNDYNIIEVTD